ncbi:putative flagellar protein FlbD [Clostridium sp. CAG:590]|nr:flagellar FlbD family protein [Clostridium sp.]CCX88805.1 putative flagellar protein FlbD [Clostridium sp. CAG:590]
MIELTKLNDIKFMVNADIIEMVEETPDTVVTLTTGKKMIVKESRQEIRDLVIAYRRSVFCRDL